METQIIRTELHHYIERGDEQFLKMMLAVANRYKGTDLQKESESAFSVEDIQKYENRRINRLNKKSKIYTWQAVKEKVRGTE